MPVLPSAKHEAVAQAYIKDPSRVGWRAYQAVYPKSSQRAAETAMGRLLKNAAFSSRIAELLAAAADATVMDLREVLAELSKLGRSNIQHVAHILVSDDVVADVKALPPEQSAAIAELTVESYQEFAGEDAPPRTIKRVKFRLHDKRGALSELRKHHEPVKHEHSGKDGGPIETKEVSDLEAARRIAFLLSQATKATKGG